MPALSAMLPQVRRYAPLNVGVAELTAGGRLREVTVLGSTSELLPIRHMTLSQGSFLAHGSERSAQIVLGSQLAREFFPDGKAIGQRIRLGDSRFLVSGVLAVQGESMGFNSDEIAIIPIDYAQELFNTSTLFRILVEARSRNAIEPAQGCNQPRPETAPRRRGGRHRHHPGRRAHHLRPHPHRADLGGGGYCRDQPGSGRDSGDERDAGCSGPCAPRKLAC